ncbi:MAG: TonB-dependent receptor [Myxococcales bacterium]|nr:TonB-dependent receptor [Myxococcales bacterium]
MMLLGLLHPEVAHADERTEARRLFRDGMTLVQAGDVAGIASLEEAYRILPHPHVIYNIARAYAEFGLYRESIRAFEQYLEWDPSDAVEVEEFIASMRELLGQQERAAEVATTAPQPAVEGETTDPTAGPAPAPERVSELGGQARAEGVYEEQVVSASRFVESSVAAPSSTTVITAQDIRLSGLQTLADVLRRAVGVEVMALSPGDQQVSIRGLNQRQSNKVLVFIDGRSVYIDSLGSTFWNVLPIGLDDIERIEIIRGAASAVYGADAFSGLINIITRTPGEGGSHVSVAAGSHGTARAEVVAHGRQSIASFRVAGGYGRADQFELEANPARVDQVVPSEDPEMARRSIWFRGDGRLNLGRGYALEMGSGVSLNRLSQYGIGRLRQLFIDEFVFAQTYLTLTTPVGITARVFWNMETADAQLAVEPPAAVPLVTRDLATHIADADVNYRARFHLGVDHNAAVGVSYRFKSIVWNWLDDSHTQNHFAAYLTDTMQLARRLQGVLNFRVDRHPLLRRPQYSPRIALLFQPTERSSLRGTFGLAFRSPTFLESYVELPVSVPGLRGVSALSLGSERLDPERMLTTEIGYRNQDSDYFALEVTAYMNLVDDAIVSSEVSAFTLGDYGSGHASYSDSVAAFSVGQVRNQNEAARFRQLGAELGVRFFPVRGLDVYANYSLHDTRAVGGVAAVGRENDQRTSRHKLNLGVQYRAPFGLDLSADFHWVSSQLWVMTIPDVETGASFGQFPLRAYALLNALLDGRLQLGVVGTNLVDPHHREHPLGQRVDRRVLGTLSLGF